MKYQVVIEIASAEAKQLYRSYMRARNAYYAADQSISMLQDSGEDVPEQLASFYEAKKAEAQRIRAQIEAIGYMVTVDIMNGYRPALGSKSGAILYTI